MALTSPSATPGRNHATGAPSSRRPPEASEPRRPNQAATQPAAGLLRVGAGRGSGRGGRYWGAGGEEFEGGDAVDDVETKKKRKTASPGLIALFSQQLMRWVWVKAWG
jgi:hypothetical protein